MKKNPWIRRGVIAGLLIAPSLAFAAVEMSNPDSSLCSLVSSFFSCGSQSAGEAPCPYSK